MAGRRFIGTALAAWLFVCSACPCEAAGAPAPQEAGNAKVAVAVAEGDEGCLSVTWKGGGDPDIKVRTAKEEDGAYGPERTYGVEGDGEPHRLPLQDGAGTYRVTVYQHVSERRYRLAWQGCVEAADAAASTAAWEGPNAIVDYDPGSELALKAAELCEGLETDVEKAGAVHAFVMAHMSYDGAKARAILDGNWTGGSYPDPDGAYESGKGVCYDFAGLLAAMLRSQGVPCMLVYGYADGTYHAWCMAMADADRWIDGAGWASEGEWFLMDPTFADASPAYAARCRLRDAYEPDWRY